MLLFNILKCLKCKEKTDSKSSKVLETNNKRIMISSKCVFVVAKRTKIY